MSQTNLYRFRRLVVKLSSALASSNSKRVALANTGWLLLDKVFRISISVLVGAWVARHLGPASYGELAYVLALLTLFQSACSLGLDGPVVRDIAQSSQSASAILGSAFCLRVAAGVVGWMAAIAVVIASRPGDQTALVMVAIAGAALVFQPADVVDLWLQSHSQSRVSIPFRLAAYFAVALGKVCLILVNAPLWAFSAAALADMVLVAGALGWVYARRPEPTAWSWDRTSAKRLLLESWPLLLSAVSIGIYMRIDQIMLRELAGERQLGLYSAAMPFSQAWQILPMTLCASLLPRLAQLRHENPALYQLRLQQLFSLMAWSGIAVAGLTAFCAPWLVGLLLGSHYQDAIPVLQWHVITNVFVFLGVAQSLAIVNERTPRVALLKTLFGAAVSVGANFLLIPRWGAIGSAWAAAISYFCSAILSNVLVAPSAFRMQLRALLPFHEARP